LLSGTYCEPEDFVRHGFPAAMQEHRIDAELVMAETRASWFADGTIVERIRDVVIQPARERGRSRIWLAGISLGGLAALCYAARHASEIEGILLISPYPATRPLLREMRTHPPLPVQPSDGDLEREAWTWLVSRVDDAHPPIHCYFASGDRFAPGQRQMAETLAPERVHERAGGHDWPTWHALWSEFLCSSQAALR
jgi:pimeloyl-ACP methyl ester carboxylesterase